MAGSLTTSQRLVIDYQWLTARELADSRVYPALLINFEHRNRIKVLSLLLLLFQTFKRSNVQSQNRNFSGSSRMSCEDFEVSVLDRERFCAIFALHSFDKDKTVSWRCHRDSAGIIRSSRYFTPDGYRRTLYIWVVYCTFLPAFRSSSSSLQEQSRLKGGQRHLISNLLCKLVIRWLHWRARLAHNPSTARETLSKGLRCVDIIGLIARQWLSSWWALLHHRHY